MKWTRFSEKKPPMEQPLHIKEAGNNFRRMGNWYYDDETGYNLYIDTTGAYEGWTINQDKTGFDDYLWLDESPSIQSGKGADSLRRDDPWSVHHILMKLTEAADILLDKKDYDGHGWEEISHARKKAKEVIESNVLIKGFEAGKGAEEAAAEFASKDFPNKSSFEYHNQYTSFLAGVEYASTIQPQGMVKASELKLTDGVYYKFQYQDIVDSGFYSKNKNGFFTCDNEGGTFYKMEEVVIVDESIQSGKGAEEPDMVKILGKHISNRDLESEYDIYKAMTEYANLKSSQQDSRIKELEEALRELVTLKDMKTKAEYNSTPSSEKWDLLIEYEKRKPLAWEAARKLINHT